ncbi:2-nitropropane dioxygenase [Sphingobium sp. TCM1]|nr:2-nitropropane dioxygenase [Sphingobium sp. TCM1]
MMLPASFAGRLRVPALTSPMFLVSGPDLVIAACRSGLLGTFPSVNQRTPEGYEEWLVGIRSQLTGADAPFGVQFSVHATNERLAADLEITIRHQVPVVITTLSISREVTDAIHSYGGLVFHDATNMRHARKALDANVDGIIAVCAGAGGHAGTLSPFAFVAELRPELRGKTLILAGAVGNGRSVAAAVAAGADMVSMGTAFIPTIESMAAQDMKEMIVASSASDIIYTDRVSGLHANFLGQTIPANLARPEGEFNVTEEISPKRWRDVWTAGHGVGPIDGIRSVQHLAEKIEREYREAVDCLTSADQAVEVNA